MFLLSYLIYYEAKTQVLPEASQEEGDLILQSRLVPRMDTKDSSVPLDFRNTLVGVCRRTKRAQERTISNEEVTGYAPTPHHSSPTEMKLRHL